MRLSLTKNTFKKINLWTDSMATLYWLLNRGTWSRYVRNRVKAIKDLGKFTWRYVPTDQNPSNLGTRGVSIIKLNEFWFESPNWLSNEMKWSNEIVETTDVTELNEKATPVEPRTKYARNPMPDAKDRIHGSYFKWERWIKLKLYSPFNSGSVSWNVWRTLENNLDVRISPYLDNWLAKLIWTITH